MTFDPHAPHPAHDPVLAAFDDAEDRIKAVINNSRPPSDLKALELDLTEPGFVDMAARHPNPKAVRLAIAELMVRSFTGSARTIEKAILKRIAQLDAERAAAQRRKEQEAQAAAYEAARQARAQAALNEEWPITRTGPHPAIESKLDSVKGVPKSCVSNALKILRDDPRWGRRIRLNLLGSDVELDGKQAPREAKFLPELCEWFADNYGLQTTIDIARQAVWATAETYAYFPVRDYLDSLPPWDGVARIHRILDEVLHAADDPEAIPIRQKFIRVFLIAAVARIYEPGCKVRTALILIGEQYVGKSTFFEALFSRPFFGDSPLDIGNKDAMMITRTTWGFEAAELDSFERATATAVKGFMSSPVDRYRAPYDTTVRAHPRQNVMCGTTNKHQFLSDPTGSSRFHPIPIPELEAIDHEWILAYRDHLWAEAVAAYRAGEKWHLDAEEDAQRARVSKEHELGDPWDSKVESYMVQHFANNKSPVLSSAVLDHLGIPVDKRTVREEARIRDILTRAGYRYTTKRDATGIPKRGWYRGDRLEQERASGPSVVARPKPTLQPAYTQEPEEPPLPDDDDLTVPVGRDGAIY